MRLTRFLLRFATLCRDGWVIRQSGLFSANHYRRQYPKPGFFCHYFPLLHYVLSGAFQGKNPNPIFDTAFYLKQNADVQSANVNPFAHYLRAGAHENRSCTPWLESVLDTEHNLVFCRDVMPALNPVVFYLTPPKNQPKSVLDTPGGFYGFLKKRFLKAFKLYVRNRQTMAILERYGQHIGKKPPPWMLVSPWLRQHWPEPQIDQSIPATALPTTYTVISTLDQDNPAYFDACAKSLKQAIAAVPNVAVEWTITCANANMDIQKLQNRLPVSLKNSTLFYRTAQKSKAELINEAAALSSGAWLLLLETKDQLALKAICALEEAMRAFPQCRLMLSAIADMDEQGHILRHRPSFVAPQDFFEQGMPYKLLAIRRDLWTLLQGFDPGFATCHDYDLALKAMLEESILCLAEPFYRYRMDAPAILTQGLEESNTVDDIRQAFIRYFATRHLGYNPPPPKPPFAANPPRGICFVRTQGKRMDYLLDALLSIQHQTQPLTPCVIVHGNHEAFAMVRAFLKQHVIQAVLLHAPDIQRRRGHPLNVGIDYLAAHQNDYDYLCFLDDDDIFYPDFAKRLSQVLEDSGKDVVFIQTMGKAIDGSIAPIHPPLPPICLVASNFIPINAYVVRADFFLEANIRFPEDMDYVEDWDILLQMLAKGATFMPCFETHAEIRLIGDGNATFKHNPEHFERCYNRLRDKGQTIAKATSIGRLLWDVAAFDWKKRPYPLHEHEMGLLEEVFAFFRAKA